MTIRIMIGDARHELTKLADQSVHCCVTSPPYFGLRDYGVAGQIGLEPTPDAFVAEMVAVFRQVRRVLRDDGTLWLNLGDSYASGGRGGGAANSKQETNVGALLGAKRAPEGYKAKDLLGIPWRVAFALQADGWYLRQDIIWSKPNPMPESVTDRCTKAHEYIFLLSKSARYFYDADAIAEPGVNRASGTNHGAEGMCAGYDGHRTRANLSKGIEAKEFRNKRSVWEVTTQPFSEAHFATFPPALIEPCIKAGTSEKGCCAKCGAPWERTVSKEFVPQKDVSEQRGVRGAENQKPMDKSNSWQGFPRGSTTATTTGWQPTCTCHGHFEEREDDEDWISRETGERNKIRVYVPDSDQPPPQPCTVLDPFGGAGTTGLVADRLQRSSVLIELNPEYAAMAERRIRDDAPLFVEAAE